MTVDIKSMKQAYCQLISPYDVYVNIMIICYDVKYAFISFYISIMFYSFNYYRCTICIYACVLCLYICTL